MKVWSDRGSTCKFRNARSAFRNLHVEPLSLHTFMRNKQVEFNPYIYTLTTLSKLYRFDYEISVFNTKHPVIILRVSLFAVTPSHVASSKIECQNFSYVYRSRKHWECKYYNNNAVFRCVKKGNNVCNVNICLYHVFVVEHFDSILLTLYRQQTSKRLYRSNFKTIQQYRTKYFSRSTHVEQVKSAGETWLNITNCGYWISWINW